MWNLLLALVIISLTPISADAYFNRAKAKNTCSDFLANTDNDNVTRAAWVLGFVTGYDASRYPEQFRGARTDVSSQEIVDGIARYCKEHPTLELAEVALTVARDLHKDDCHGPCNLPSNWDHRHDAKPGQCGRIGNQILCAPDKEK